MNEMFSYPRIDTDKIYRSLGKRQTINAKQPDFLKYTEIEIQKINKFY